MSHFAQPLQVPNVALVWFRGTDLRLHDNEIVALAHANHDYVVHMYCWDDRVFRGSVDFSRNLPVTSWPKTGIYRSKFVLEAIQDLRSSIVTASNQKQNLFLRKGLSEDVVSEMANLVGANVVYCFEAEAPEERDLQDKLRTNLQINSRGCRLHPVWGNTMYHIDDMPLNFMQKFPPTATQFRTVVERQGRIRDPIASPGSPITAATRCPAFKPLPGVVADTSLVPTGDVPTLSELLGRPLSVDDVGDMPVSNMHLENGSSALMTFVGGETAGLARVQEYFFTKDCLKDYFSTRNGLLGADYSSKFSPWLAAGCLSARHIAAEVKRYEAERVKSKETYWMLFELTFRDYFRYYTRFHGS